VPAQRFHGWFVALAAAVVLLPRLGGPALWDDDEPKNAACSLAMLDRDDWVVPTFNGRLRVEKPPLVNWIQIAGFTLCGRDETGARLGSAVATIGSCLLTWQIGCLLFGPAEGLVGGLAMATCVWTAVGGRAATPDAPLTFLTTLALWLFARGIGPEGRHGGRTRLPLGAAVAVGTVLGLATLAKGPVGLVLPLAAMCLCGACAGGGRVASAAAAAAEIARGVAGARPAVILATAVAVSAPWYAWVTIRTAGEWPRGFLLVHNLERFARPLEGHSGSLLYYPAVLCIGLFPWSIVLAAMLAHGAAILRSRDDERRGGFVLVACWLATWLGCFSLAGTKLPGYIWPAYPALAVATGVFLVDWTRGRTALAAWMRDPALDPRRLEGVVMRVAWCILAIAGIVVAIGLPVLARRAAPGAAWLFLPGIVPLAAAVVAWRSQSAGRPWRALAAVAGGGCLFVATLAAPVAEWFSRAQGPRTLVAGLPQAAADCDWACLWNVPPSLVFYTGCCIAKLDTAADVARHLTAHPRSRVVIDSRQADLVLPLVPAGAGVLARVPTIGDHDYLLLGPAAAGAVASPLALHVARDAPREP
jgi:4-amino-4-deoxy-L-arabinose transferase-like glycosyltransferase